VPEPVRVVHELFALFGAAAPDPLDRMPLIRTGERAPIAEPIRRGVWRRDGGCCQWCGYAYDLQIDHIVPWSNGGSDRSDNLRLLCASCNEARSNRRTDIWSRVLPLAFECRRCVRPQRYLNDDDEPVEFIEQADPVSAYCVTCRTPGISEHWATM
jgi:HNH endonuclease